jgi:hypothetical protein
MAFMLCVFYIMNKEGLHCQSFNEEQYAPSPSKYMHDSACISLYLKTQFLSKILLSQSLIAQLWLHACRHFYLMGKTRIYIALTSTHLRQLLVLNWNTDKLLLKWQWKTKVIHLLINNVMTKYTALRQCVLTKLCATIETFQLLNRRRATNHWNKKCLCSQNVYHISPRCIPVIKPQHDIRFA